MQQLHRDLDSRNFSEESEATIIHQFVQSLCNVLKSTCDDKVNSICLLKLVLLKCPTMYSLTLQKCFLLWPRNSTGFRLFTIQIVIIEGEIDFWYIEPYVLVVGLIFVK